MSRLKYLVDLDLLRRRAHFLPHDVRRQRHSRSGNTLTFSTEPESGNLDFFSIMDKFIDVLEKIEDGELGQHEGANEVGKLLKKIYIDSALKQADKLDAERGDADVPKRPSPRKIGYREFKVGSSSV